MIEIESVSKSYGEGHRRLQVLDNLAFKAFPETFNVILGRSGSGKSTLLNLLAGLDRPDGGRIMINGRPLPDMKPAELSEFRLRQIGMIFQFFNLLPTLSLYENVALPGHLLGLDSRKLHERAAEALHLVNLFEERNRMPHEASGGEIQRAAIARALVTRPPLLLADEPTGNLDEGNRENVLDILARLVREKGITLVAVSHDPAFEEHADRILHLESGRLKS